MAKSKKPCKYEKWLKPQGIKRIEAWARDGLIDEQIAHNMGIGVSTYYKWKKMFPSMQEALSRGKEIVDIEVENALLKRALGYTSIETTKELIDEELKVTKVIEKEERPDTTAQIFWLKNRKRDTWKEKQEVEITGEVNNPFKTLTEEELKAMIGK